MLPLVYKQIGQSITQKESSRLQMKRAVVFANEEGNRVQAARQGAQTSSTGAQCAHSGAPVCCLLALIPRNQSCQKPVIVGGELAPAMQAGFVIKVVRPVYEARGGCQGCTFGDTSLLLVGSALPAVPLREASVVQQSAALPIRATRNPHLKCAAWV